MTNLVAMRVLPFIDRRDAGKYLADQLRVWADRQDVLILGLPRGGVPVAFEVARVLAAPLDVYVVRKLGVPGREEFAMGAMASGGAEFVDTDVVAALGITERQLELARQRESLELERREALYRGAPMRPLSVEGRTMIVIDDGLATGATMYAGLLALRMLQPARLIAAAPVGMPDACVRVAEICDSLVCPWRPQNFVSVGQAYENFDATSDEEVIRLLDEAAQFGADSYDAARPK
ncbi:MAG: phosphoribosyltransferase family protein [Ottowia sp.]|uniref:phosphoribosyltransferase n=1 Tax=Ottowia sp. TaxID=1898956 RepID=UPI003C724B1B